MKRKTIQPDTCVVCGSMSLRLLKDRVTNDPILSPEGMKIYRCERCEGFSNERKQNATKDNNLHDRQ